uniref:MADS-box domain-containing protein n=1 Tax=Populus trichocarpa TaxID=3694 RepID=A0A3N7G4R5_POPTR
MARGKIAITKIENRTARQVTFSKRRVGLFKKTHELSVLCDAEIGLIVFSSNGNLSEFCSESSSIPHIIKRYEISKGMRVSESNDSEQILKELKRIRKETDDLQLSMRCYKGESLSSLHYEDLVELEKQLECSVNKVRARKVMLRFMNKYFC